MRPWRKSRPPLPLEKVSLTADDAWKTLTLVNEWIKHGETKAAVSLAAGGVSGGVIFNILKSEPHHSLLTTILAGACATCVSLTATFAGVALWPRLKATEDPTSTLYFNHIARKHKTSNAEYSVLLAELIQDKERLVIEISEQVWSNAHVATKKYKWGSWAIIFLFASIALLGATGFAVLTT